MPATELALFISIISILIAGTSLGWNIYRDVILKPRLKVVFGVWTVIGNGVPEQTYVMISATNHGPGSVKVNVVHGRNQTLWQRIRGKGTYFVVMTDDSNPLSGKLPAHLEVGEKVSLFLPYTSDSELCLLSKPFTKIGVSDNFDNNHWASKKDIDKAKEQFKKDFPHDE